VNEKKKLKSEGGKQQKKLKLAKTRGEKKTSSREKINGKQSGVERRDKKIQKGRTKK
jgi:hypothetical protein